MTTKAVNHPCAGKVLSGDGWNRYPCRTLAKYEEAGKWWCGQHQPAAVQARRDKAHEKFEARYATLKTERAKAKATHEAQAELEIIARKLLTFESITYGPLGKELRDALAKLEANR